MENEWHDWNLEYQEISGHSQWWLLHANLIAVLEVRMDMHGTERKNIILFSIKDININCEVHIYPCITETNQQLRELSIEDFNKELVREDSFKQKTMIKSLHPASWISTSWVPQGHGMHEHEDGTFLWRPRNNSPSNQGHNTQHHPWLHLCENLKIHNNNVIALTFIHPNT